MSDEPNAADKAATDEIMFYQRGPLDYGEMRRMVMSALAQARQSGLEEAAVICERLELASGGRGADGDDCAAAIRALLDSPPAEGASET